MVWRKYLVLAVFGAAIVAFMGSSALAQRRGPRGGGFGAAGKLMLLQNADVRKELETSDEQNKDLDALQQEIRNQFREMFSGMRNLPADQRREAFQKMRDKMRQVGRDMESKVNKILLPNQIARLDQIDLQMQMRRRGTEGALSSDAVVKALGITDAQKKQLQEVAAQAQKDLQEAINKAREDARKKIMAVLTKEQQDKLNGMLGKQFEMQRGFRGPGGGRRAGGRPGGNRPGN